MLYPCSHSHTTRLRLTLPKDPVPIVLMMLYCPSLILPLLLVDMGCCVCKEREKGLLLFPLWCGEKRHHLIPSPTLYSLSRMILDTFQTCHVHLLHVIFVSLSLSPSLGYIHILVMFPFVKYILNMFTLLSLLTLFHYIRVI